MFKWRTPLTRISEMIAVSAITFASLIIIVDMGRPERLVNLFTHGRLQSPIMWDVIVITTYFCISLFLLYITLLPDIRIMINAKEMVGKPFAKLYKWLGSYWKGTDAQEKIRNQINYYSLYHYYPCSILHTHRYFLVICYYLQTWLGQHQLWSLFCFRCIFSWCRRCSCCHVCFSPRI